MRSRGFGELEAVVMDRVWGHGPDTTTVREVFDELAADREIAYTPDARPSGQGTQICP